MASYLEAYGAAEQHRARVLAVVKNCSIVLAAVLLAGLILFTIYRNHTEERQAKNFLGRLEARNYAAAYTLWGCTDTRPCPQYPSINFVNGYCGQGRVSVQPHSVYAAA